MTTQNHDELEESACFEANGHVTDLVVTCLADGETSLVPATATTHVEACDACTARVGAEALLSVGATDALLAAAASRAQPSVVAQTGALPLLDLRADAARAPAPPTPSSRRRRPLPIGAIAAALFVAVLGSAPGWMDSLREARALVPGVVHALPIWSRALEAVLRSMMESRGGAEIRWMVSAAFIAAGALLARSMSRKQLLEGGLG